jgi:hypothetical protein
MDKERMNHPSPLCFSVVANNSFSYIEYFIELVKKSNPSNLFSEKH